MASAPARKNSRTDRLFLIGGHREPARPDHGAPVWPALTDPEFAAKVGDRQLTSRHLVPVQPLRLVRLRQALRPTQTIARLQCPRRAGLFTLGCHRAMLWNDPSSPTSTPHCDAHQRTPEPAACRSDTRRDGPPPLAG